MQNGLGDPKLLSVYKININNAQGTMITAKRSEWVEQQ